MAEKRKIYISLAINAIIVVLEAVGFYGARSLGWGQFWFYTQISNLLLGIVCILLSLFLLRCLRNGSRIPFWLNFLKYTITIMVAQTFLVSLTVLSIAWGGIGAMMLGPVVRYFHTLCPLLAVASFLFFDPQEKPFTLKHNALAMTPTIIYGAVAITLNVLRIWHGPYPFLYVYEQPVWLSIVWFVVIMGAAFLIAVLLRLLHKRINRRYIY